MNKKFILYPIILGSVVLTMVGVLIEVLDGVAIRTNIAPDTVALTIFDPLLPGSIVKPRWNVTKNSPHQEVELVLRTEGKEYTLTHTKFTYGNSRIVVPCDIVSGTARLELVGQQQRDVISAVSVEILSPGPDCVR